MRVVGLAFAGAVALAVAAQAAPPEAVRTGGDLASGIVQIGDGDGTERQSSPNRATGSAGQWKGGWRKGQDRAPLALGDAMPGPGSLPTGSGVRAAGPLIIHLQTGEDRTEAGAILNMSQTS